MSTLSILLQAQAENGSLFGAFMPIIIMVAIFYFLIIRPQNKRQKEIDVFRASLSIGSRVVTGGGLFGYVKEISDNEITLEIAPNVKVKVMKNQVFACADSAQPSTKSESKD